MRKLIFFSVIVFTFSMAACKKESSDNNSFQPNQELVAKVNKWLDEQKIGLINSSSIVIDSVKANLNYSQLRLEPYNDSQDFIVVPISNRFKSKNNNGKNPANYLVLVLKQKDSITRGNIIQFVSSESEKTVPQNTFTKIFTYQNLLCNGRFTILSVTDYFKLELLFENGKLKSVAEQIKRSIGNNSSGKSNGCIDWYLITTYYNDNGTPTITEQFLYTICDDPCNETRIINGRSLRTNCGGGGNNNIDYIYVIARPWKWDLATSPNWWAESYETVTGVRNNNEPQSGHFTNIAHVNSYFVTSLPGYTWQELGNTVSIDNPQKVYSSTTGKAIHGGTFTNHSANAYRSFSEIFGNTSQ